MGASTRALLCRRKRRAKASSYSLDDYLSFGKNDYVSPTVRPSHPKPFIAQQSVEMARASVKTAG